VRASATPYHEKLLWGYAFIFKPNNSFQCDSDDDGRVSVAELRTFLANNEGYVPDRVVKCLHRCFDKNQDHQLDFDEFLDLMIDPAVTSTFKRIGSRYLKFVAPSSIRRRSLTLRRNISNTGLYEEEITFNQYTVGMLVLSIVQIVCYYVDMELDYAIRDYTEFNSRKKYQVWRYVTFVLDHGSALHLYGNVAVQLILGLPLEMVHSWRVLVIYLAGAVGGCLVQAVACDDCALIGGSPGVFSFYSAHLAIVIMNWREMSHPIVHLIIFLILIIFGAIRDYFMYMYESDQGISSNISYLSHIGGIVPGFLLGIIVLRNIRKTKMEKIVWNLSVVILCCLTVGFVVYNITMEFMH
ncbi:hypothetical protein NQ315_002354, partial [Exocentrus adspersus]